jgi:hypothetical protein
MANTNDLDVDDLLVVCDAPDLIEKVEPTMARILLLLEETMKSVEELDDLIDTLPDPQPRKGLDPEDERNDHRCRILAEIKSTQCNLNGMLWALIKCHGDIDGGMFGGWRGRAGAPPRSVTRLIVTGAG